MKLYRHFDKDKLMEIAKQANNKQIVKDVSYAAFKQYHDGNVLCEWIENTAFIIFLIQKENVRVIGLCTTIQNRGGGMQKCF